MFVLQSESIPTLELPLLSESERHQLLVEWNDTRSDYPAQSSVQALFEEQAEATADATALLFGEETITYAELNRRANQMAHYLLQQGVGAESRVGICLDRSPALIIGVLGILKAGGAYVPLDPGYPSARLSFMLADAGVTLLLTEKQLRPSFQDQKIRTICVDELAEQIAACDETDPQCDIGADNLAYVMYTSGSTGTPKGVAVTHRNIVRLVKNTNYASFTRAEVFLQFAPVSFDASTFEIWGALLNGARLVIFPPHAPSLSELGEFIRKSSVTTMWLTAGLFHQVIDRNLEGIASVRQLL